jgi:hypothetical protein
VFYALVVERQKVKERPEDGPVKDSRYTAATSVLFIIPERKRGRGEHTS